jgi:hypothetical protein
MATRTKIWGTNASAAGCRTKLPTELLCFQDVAVTRTSKFATQRVRTQLALNLWLLQQAAHIHLPLEERGDLEG